MSDLTIVRPIPDGAKRAWALEVNGVEVPDVQSIRLTSKFGVVEYGYRPGKDEDDWLFKENGGGGSVTLPFAISPSGVPFIGLALENRDNLSGPHYCILGGFVDPGETHEEAAGREAKEEGGVSQVPILLQGLPTVSNRRFFVCDPNKGEGVHSYAARVPWVHLESSKGHLVHSTWKPINRQVHFMHWKEAIKVTPDALGRSAIVQLLAITLPG